MANYKPAPRFQQFDGLTRQQWKEKCQPQWIAFQASINDANRGRVRRLAMSHWHTLKDLEWVAENLPKLVELDLSDVQDAIVCDGDIPDGYWRVLDDRGRLTTQCHGFFHWDRTPPELWSRLEKLCVRHWGCNRLQDSRFRHVDAGGWIPNKELRLDGGGCVEIRSRRETLGGRGQDVTSVVAQCKKLRTLVIRGPSLDPSLGRSWRPRHACADDEGSHAHVCAIVKGLVDKSPESLRKVEFLQAEFAPQMVSMLRERMNLPSITFSFGDVLRRYAPGREPDVRKDDPSEYAAEHAKFPEYPPAVAEEATRLPPLYEDLATCQFQTSKRGEPEIWFHERLDRNTFPRLVIRDWLKESTAKYMSLWGESINLRVKQSGPESVLSGTEARLMEYFLIYKDERPGPGLRDFLGSVRDVFSDGHCDGELQFTCNDQQIINDIPVSIFSFLTPCPTQTGLDASPFTTLHRAFNWTPLWDIDPLIDPQFPWNAGLDIPLHPSTDAAAPMSPVLAPIVRAFRALSRREIPVRLLIGNRPRLPISASTGLYWGGATTATAAPPPAWKDPLPPAAWLTSPVKDASRPLSTGRNPDSDDSDGNDTHTIASLASELTIRYPDRTGACCADAGDADGTLLARMLRREARGWQRWWRAAAPGLAARLRRLRIRMPRAFDGYESAGLAALLLRGGGGWRVRLLPGERGEAVEFVVREWSRGGDGGGVEGGLESGDEIEEEVSDVVEGWWDEERAGKEARRLWEAWEKAWGEEMEEIQVERTPDREIGESQESLKMEVEDSVLIEDTQVEETQVEETQVKEEEPSVLPWRTDSRPLTPISPPFEPLTPVHTPPSQMPLQPSPPEELETPPAPKKPRRGRAVERTPSPFRSPSEESEASPTPRKARRSRTAKPSKKPEASKKRGRSAKSVDTRKQREESEAPPPKKKAKKSRWERELELLKS
ncbi:hypothetical protein GTA08_BOTSDO11139 [Neofusicoccum parvum]|uniref:Uncharacterized protein n=1 Tax=Neofusicoccum parvum TaxID=310453 RepID=A0ACB5RMW7_9PEZI|nr:hypothetical protein GTA08_BOTSDO11139 [Neofusicoccum parvum]